MTLLWLFWQILISYCKFLMPRPLKWSILGAHTIILSKKIHKVTKTDYVWFEFLWIRRYLLIPQNRTALDLIFFVSVLEVHEANVVIFALTENTVSRQNMTKKDWPLHKIVAFTLLQLWRSLQNVEFLESSTFNS